MPISPALILAWTLILCAVGFSQDTRAQDSVSTDDAVSSADDSIAAYDAAASERDTASESVDGRQSSAGRPFVLRVHLDDQAVTPMMARFLDRALGEATERDAAALLVELDTPGGLLQSTRHIVKSFFGSRVPIIVYVAPAGSRAASAGVFITMAAHVAAMAPGTHIGAAHPVSIGGGAPDTTGGVMDEKVMNDTRAWARSIAETRGRSAEWAEAAITRSESIVAEEAVALNVVDLTAPDRKALLSRIDGRNVDLEHRTVTLQTENAVVETLEPWWGERLLGAISDPNVAFILLLLGFYAIVFEFYSGGWGVPGTVGAICLLLGFFGMAVLPINIIGLALIAVGLGFFVAEAFVPSFGLLTIGGVVCLILGGLMLVDSPLGVVEVSKSVVIPIAVASGVIAFFLMGQVVRAHRVPLQTGSEQFIGATAAAADSFVENDGEYSGMVWLQGELWTAGSSEPVSKGDAVRIIDRSGLLLTVEPSGVSSRPADSHRAET